MRVYTAFLRGINVGKSHRVRMEALRDACEGLGLARVRTYIQSGNLIFESGEPEGTVRARLEAGLETALGFPVPIVLLPAEELDDIVSAYPFTAPEREAAATIAAGAETEYVYLWNAPPALDATLSAYAGPDRWAAHGRALYLLLFQSIRDSKLPAVLAKLPPATARNLRVLTEVARLAKERGDAGGAAP